MKLSASNYSKSSKCSPVPIKIIGLSVAATADKAPPPLACPSNLVIITDPTETQDLKALAWAKQACPIELSITKIISSGFTAASTYCISSNNSVSYLCLPEVSTIIISYLSFLKVVTPSSAIYTGSVSL